RAIQFPRRSVHDRSRRAHAHASRQGSSPSRPPGPTPPATAYSGEKVVFPTVSPLPPNEPPAASQSKPQAWPFVESDASAWPTAEGDEEAFKKELDLAKLEVRKKRTDEEIALKKAETDADLALDALFYESIFEVAKGAIDRTRASADFVQKGAGA